MNCVLAKGEKKKIYLQWQTSVMPVEGTNKMHSFYWQRVRVRH